MSIESVCERIRDLGLKITGVKDSFETIPGNIETANLPAQMVVAGPSVYDDEAGGNEFTFITRTYRIVYLVLPHGQGAREQAESSARPLIDTANAFWDARKSLENLAWVQDTRVIGDTGVIRLEFYDGRFIGFEVRLEVTEYAKKSYVDY